MLQHETASSYKFSFNKTLASNRNNNRETEREVTRLLLSFSSTLYQEMREKAKCEHSCRQNIITRARNSEDASAEN